MMPYSSYNVSQIDRIYLHEDSSEKLFKVSLNNAYCNRLALSIRKLIHSDVSKRISNLIRLPEASYRKI